MEILKRISTQFSGKFRENSLWNSANIYREFLTKNFLRTLAENTEENSSGNFSLIWRKVLQDFLMGFRVKFGESRRSFLRNATKICWKISEKSFMEFHINLTKYMEGILDRILLLWPQILTESTFPKFLKNFQSFLTEFQKSCPSIFKKFFLIVFSSESMIIFLYYY